MTVRPTEFSSAIADHRSCQMHRQVFWVTLGDPLLERKRRHACTGRQPRVVVLPTGASLQLLRYQPFRRKHGCHLVASHSPALRWNLKVASTTTPTHGASGTARHDRLRQIGDAGAAHAERDWSPNCPKCRAASAPTRWVVPGYALARSWLDGSELFPVYLTTGPDPGLVVSTGLTAVPPIQLPVGVTAGGAELLSCTTCSPK